MEPNVSPWEWRGREIHVSRAELEQSQGGIELARIEKKFVLTIQGFIREIFNYNNIEVIFTKENLAPGNIQDHTSGELESDGFHTRFFFAMKLFNNQLFKFEVINIPATPESRHIKVFFRVLMVYIRYFYDSVQHLIPVVDGRLKPSFSFITICDIWLYNIERTIIIEYLFCLFNAVDHNSIQQGTTPQNTIRYDIDLINKIYDFSLELNTKKIENKDVYCGFIFHTDLKLVEKNAIDCIKFVDPIRFGNFGRLKNYLQISNGLNSFFNVTNNKITHLIFMKQMHKFFFGNVEEGQKLENNPLVVSIQGNGKIFFVEGRSNQNKIILQIINSKHIIRDTEFIRKFLIQTLSDFSNATKTQIELFSKWIMSLSLKKHGSSLIFKDITPEIEARFIKTIKISISSDLFSKLRRRRHDIIELNSIVNPDGAVIFNEGLRPTHISTLLPIENVSCDVVGGSRHNSVANFTKVIDCLGIVISEDGPITIYNKGEVLIRF